MEEAKHKMPEPGQSTRRFPIASARRPVPEPRDTADLGRSGQPAVSRLSLCQPGLIRGRKRRRAAAADVHVQEPQLAGRSQAALITMIHFMEKVQPFVVEAEKQCGESDGIASQ